MEFREIIDRALDVRNKYADFEKEKIGREWSNSELMEGFVKNTGNLMYAVMGKEGSREVEDAEGKIDHEISDCLWTLIILADRYGIDLEKSFLSNMYKLDERLKSGNG